MDVLGAAVKNRFYYWISLDWLGLAWSRLDFGGVMEGMQSESSMKRTVKVAAHQSSCVGCAGVMGIIARKFF
jgi:hypothetical protein